MSGDSLHASATRLLENWRPTVDSDESLRHTLLAFMDAAPKACLREHAPGHVTASSLVLDHTGRQVLLTLHPRVGRWIQLGGHCEPTDETVVDAALREAREESGIDALTIDPELLSANTHPITCSLGVPTRHLDLRFLVRAPAGARITRSEESTDLRWFPVNDLPADAEKSTIDHLVQLADNRQRTGAS
ncbi:NUDIX hydrolase [Rhodococcus sp. NPDC058521]|uniref:NUDIX hydrolase n=1 Tax=Rhodococcus sp. NPDC058521 TaxID=3346536 RepID=UPI00365ECCFF